MLRIEFLGSPYSGKSFIKNDIIQHVQNKKYIFYSYRSFFDNYISKYPKLHLLDRLIFKSIENNGSNIQGNGQNKKSYLTKPIKLLIKKIKKIRILSIKKNIYKIFSVKNEELHNELNFFFKRHFFDHLRKNDLERWYIEMCSSYYIFDEFQFSNVAILDSEGFIHRLNSFIINHYDETLINNYLELIPKPHILIYVNESYEICKKRLLDENQSQKIFKYEDTLKTYHNNSELIYNKIKNQKLKIFIVNSINYNGIKKEIIKYIDEFNHFK